MSLASKNISPSPRVRSSLTAYFFQYRFGAASEFATYRIFSSGDRPRPLGRVWPVSSRVTVPSGSSR